MSIGVNIDSDRHIFFHNNPYEIQKKSKNIVNKEKKV